MDDETLELLMRSSVPGAKIIASKVTEAHVNGTDFTLSEDEQRTIDDAKAAAASAPAAEPEPDPDLEPQPAQGA